MYAWCCAHSSARHRDAPSACKAPVLPARGNLPSRSTLSCSPLQPAGLFSHPKALPPPELPAPQEEQGLAPDYISAHKARRRSSSQQSPGTDRAVADQKPGCNPLIAPEYIFFLASGLSVKRSISTHAQLRSARAALWGLPGTGQWPSFHTSPQPEPMITAFQRLHAGSHAGSQLLAMPCWREWDKAAPLEGMAPQWVSPSLSHLSLIIFVYCLKRKWLSAAIISFPRLLSQRSLWWNGGGSLY